MEFKLLGVSSKSDQTWQIKICFDQVSTTVTVKENFPTELLSADPNKVLKDPPPRPEITRNGEDAIEKQARLLRDNVERVDIL